MDLPVAPMSMIELLRGWFFAKDRSIVMANNTFIKGTNEPLNIGIPDDNFGSLIINHSSSKGGASLIKKENSNSFVSVSGFEGGDNIKRLFIGGGSWGYYDAQEIRLYTDPISSATNQGIERVRITSSGDVGIAATSEPSANGGAVLFFGDNAADPTMAANTAGFYGKDVAGTVEAFAVDEAGNAAQLTPHNFTLFTPNPSFEYPWSYYAKNKYIGREINVDLFGMIRAVENLTGEQFIYLQDLPASELSDWNVEQEKEVLRSVERRKKQQENKEIVENLYIKKSMPDWMKNLENKN